MGGVASKRHSNRLESEIWVFAPAGYTLRKNRTLAGMALGAAVPILLNAWFMGPLWHVAIIVGVICAAVLILFVALPLTYWLNNRGSLRIWWIVSAAGGLAAVPDLMISLLGILLGNFSLYAHGEVLVVGGLPTWAGFVHFFLARPAAYWFAGALGGLAFWLLAVRPTDRLGGKRAA